MAYRPDRQMAQRYDKHLQWNLFGGKVLKGSLQCFWFYSLFLRKKGSHNQPRFADDKKGSCVIVKGSPQQLISPINRDGILGEVLWEGLVLIFSIIGNL
jgi:hypothetical protein